MTTSTSSSSYTTKGIYASGLASLSRKPSPQQKGFLRVGADTPSGTATTSTTSTTTKDHVDLSVNPFTKLPWKEMEKATASVWGIVAIASSLAGGYHGYKRNASIGWGLWWGLMGGVFPILTPGIAVYQGFGKRVGK